MIKLAVITSTRAEYGLLCPLIKRLMQEASIELQVLASGTHLLERFGKTIDYIRADGIPVADIMPIFEEDFISDEIHVAQAVAKAAQLGGIIFDREKYDGIILLGDRYELLGFASAAVICRTPIIHIHGGEITEGAIDDKIRHAVTKLASIHFPSVQEYADRIIQMGENPDFVYPVGALGIDNIMHMQFTAKDDLLRELAIETDLPIAAVTYHPVTGADRECAVKEIRQVMDALLDAGVFSVITMPNSDVGGDDILKEVSRYVAKYKARMALKKSLGQLRYLSLLKHADVMVGNSSSGILESASFRLPTVNIGDRQKGRMSPDNVIHCICEKREIEKAIRHAMKKEFREALKTYVNPYGDGNAAERIAAILKKIDFSNEALIRKKFYAL